MTHKIYTANLITFNFYGLHHAYDEGKKRMSKSRGVSVSTHNQQQLNRYSNQKNPNNSAHQANNNNHANQCNPNNSNYQGHQKGK